MSKESKAWKRANHDKTRNIIAGMGDPVLTSKRKAKNQGGIVKFWRKTSPFPGNNWYRDGQFRQERPV